MTVRSTTNTTDVGSRDEIVVEVKMSSDHVGYSVDVFLIRPY